MTIHFSQAGLDALLRSPEVFAMTKRAADEIAAKVDAQHILVGGVGGVPGGDRVPITVQVETFILDGRAVASVELAHPAGIAAQAKYGLLTRGASEIGVRVGSAG